MNRSTTIDWSITFSRACVAAACLLCPAVVPPALGDKIYFTDDGLMYKANLDGTGRERIDWISNASSLALDVQGGQMYWTWGEINRANLDGSNIETIVPLSAGGSYIALDPHTDKVYWTSFAQRISRADLDGSDIEMLTTSLNPRQIALDVAGGIMYWADDNGISPGIYQANLDGTRRRRAWAALARISHSASVFVG